MNGAWGGGIQDEWGEEDGGVGCSPPTQRKGWGFGRGGCPMCAPSPHPQGKELPTLKDVDFLNKSEKVYVGEEDKRDFMEKLKRDVEVSRGGEGGRGAGGAPLTLLRPPSLPPRSFWCS